MRRAFGIFWAFVAWPLALVWLSLTALVSIPPMIFVPFRRYQASYPAKMMGLTPLVALSRYTVTYDPKFDRSRRCMFVQNHVSFFDGFISLWAIPHYFCGIQLGAHFKVPFYGWLMKAGGGIPVYSNTPNQSARLIAEAKDRQAKGYSILTFPEGHRTRTGKVGPFRRGAFAIACATGMSVVPVVVRGLFEVFPKRAWYVRPFGHIDIYVGRHFEIEGSSDEDLDALMVEVHAYMTHYLEHGAPPTCEAEPETRAVRPVEDARSA